MYSSSHYSPPRSQDYRISDPYSSRMYPRRRSRSRSRSSERYYSERLSSGLSYVPHQRTRDEYPENRPRRHASPSPPPPRPATPPNGMTGTNLIPLASRKPHISQMETNVSSATKNASAATIPTVPAATLPVVTETTANTIPAILAIGEAPIPPGLSVTAQVRESRRELRLRKYLEGPADPVADIVVWTAVSVRMVRKDTLDYIGAFSFVWEKGRFKDKAHTFSGPYKSNVYAEFLAAVEAIKKCPDSKSVLIKTSGQEVINAIVNGTETDFVNVVNRLREDLRELIGQRSGKVFFKKVPSKCGLLENDTAWSMAEEARKTLEEQHSVVTEPSATRGQATALASSSSSQPQQRPPLPQYIPPANSQAQTSAPQQPVVQQSPQPHADVSIQEMLRQRALASMRVAKDQQLDSMNKMMPNSSSNTSVPSIRESLATLRPMNLSGENRSSKARKTDYTSTPSQQQQQNQQPDQGTRDPRLLRLIEPSVITNYLASPSGIGRSTEHLPRQREATQQFQNNVRSFPSTDTARSRNVSLERSNGFPTSSSINRSVPVKRKIQEEEKEEDTDQFFDALDHWVGKYREDMEYAEGQDPDTKVDPSATLSWISGII